MTVDPSYAPSGSGVFAAWTDQQGNFVALERDGVWHRLADPGGLSDDADRASTEPVLSSGPGGRVWLALDIRPQNAVTVHRWESGTWKSVGDVIGTGKRTAPHISSVSLALQPDGGSVAYELRDDGEARKIVVRSLVENRWVTSFERALTGKQGYSAHPKLISDDHGQLRLVFVDGTGAAARLRVFGPDKRGWQELSQGLASFSVGGVTGFDGVMDSNGGLVIAWQQQTKKKATVRVARLLNGSWTELPAPEPLERNVDETEPPRLAALSDESLVLADARSDETGLFYVHLKRFRAGRWELVAEQLHLDTGQSNAEAPFIVPMPQASFAVFWDEPGDDGVRLRGILARNCKADEKPNALPPAPTRESFWPPSVDAAARKLLSEGDGAVRARLATIKRERLIELHFSLGMWIRNNYGLWTGNAGLLASCKEREPDGCSMEIIEHAWDLLHTDAGQP